MKNITKEQIEQYWLDGDYDKIRTPGINDLCWMWAEEEGIQLPNSFEVNEFNSPFFRKMNSEKHAINLILQKFHYPIVETESLTMDLKCAIQRATQLYEANGNGVIRANRSTAGLATYIIQHPRSIRMMISNLLNHPKGAVMPLYSPYYKADVEYGVYIVKGQVELVVAKKLNKETGMHNLSLGAQAEVVTDSHILEELKTLCAGLSELFSADFFRVDVMDTTQGLKIIELSIPNFKRFSIQDKDCLELGKELFLKYYNAFYR